MSQRLISRGDKDLLLYDWYINDDGMLQEDSHGFLLAHIVGQRSFTAAGHRMQHPLPSSMLITFDNNNQLDCRRSNLTVWWRHVPRNELK